MRYNPCNTGDSSPAPEPIERNTLDAPVRSNPITAGTDVVAFSENPQKKGIELRFDKAPSEAVRNELKGAGWRWSRFGGCWYVKDSPEQRQWANEFIARCHAMPVFAHSNEVEKTHMALPELPDGAEIGHAIVAAPGSAFEAELARGLQSSRSFVLPKRRDVLELAAKVHRKILTQFIGRSQMAVVNEGCRGEEYEYFYDILKQFAVRIAAMPQTYDQDGKGDAAVVTLHYFAGGQANWYITEKDKGAVDDAVPGEQHQAFGLADLFGDGGELGYISIAEILANGGELDFHFEPCTLAELAGAARTSEPPEPIQPATTPPPAEPASAISTAPVASVPLWRQRLRFA